MFLPILITPLVSSNSSYFWFFFGFVVSPVVFFLLTIVFSLLLQYTSPIVPLESSKCSCHCSDWPYQIQVYISVDFRGIFAWFFYIYTSNVEKYIERRCKISSFRNIYIFFKWKSILLVCKDQIIFLIEENRVLIVFPPTIKAFRTT